MVSELPEIVRPAWAPLIVAADVSLRSDSAEVVCASSCRRLRSWPWTFRQMKTARCGEMPSQQGAPLHFIGIPGSGLPFVVRIWKWWTPAASGWSLVQTILFSGVTSTMEMPWLAA